MAVIAGALLLAAAPGAAAQAPPGAIQASPERLDVGTHLVGSATRHTLRFTNVSSQPVHIFSAGLSGDGGFRFDFASNTCTGRTLNPGEFCSFDVLFVPLRRGNFLAHAELSHQGNVRRLIRVTGRAVRTEPIPHPNTLQVDDDRKQCPKAHFQRVQSAIRIAEPGDRVEVCPGTYVEQLVIDTKPQLALEARTPGTATIKLPRLTTKRTNAIIEILGSREVDVRGLVLSGPFASARECVSTAVERASTHSAVYVRSSHGVVIEGNRITRMIAANPAMRHCDDGYGVMIPEVPIGASSGDADVVSNSISRYQAAAVSVTGDRSSAHVISNAIALGAPLVSSPAGIVVGETARARIEGNSVRGNVHAGGGSGRGIGILLADPDLDVTVVNNRVTDNDANIVARDTESALFDGNTALRAIVGAGIEVDAGSTDNVFSANVALGNAGGDCIDRSSGAGTAGTANEWRPGNRGRRNVPAGICTP